MELTKPSTSSSGDSIDLRTSFTDWARGKLNQLTETPDTVLHSHCLGEVLGTSILLYAIYKALPLALTCFHLTFKLLNPLDQLKSFLLC